LLIHADQQLKQRREPLITVGQHVIDTTQYRQTPGYVKQSFSQEEITPDMLNVSVTKSDNSPSWGTLYLQYLTPLKNAKGNNNKSISIEKEFFIEQITEGKRVLLPLNRSISTGDKVIVRFTIKTDRDMQYVHLKNFNAACLDPVNQFSGMMRQNGLTYYQDTKNAASNLFFDYLPKGTHILEYPMWVTQGGVYQAGIAKIQCLYAPEFTAHSGSQTIKVEKFLHL
jgi:uncharacterized protein YfaS (alpha-2-macroglobulin family)